MEALFTFRVLPWLLPLALDASSEPWIVFTTLPALKFTVLLRTAPLPLEAPAKISFVLAPLIFTVLLNTSSLLLLNAIPP